MPNLGRLLTGDDDTPRHVLPGKAHEPADGADERAHASRIDQLLKPVQYHLTVGADNIRRLVTGQMPLGTPASSADMIKKILRTRIEKWRIVLDKMAALVGSESDDDAKE